MIKTVYIIRHGEAQTQTDDLGRLLIHPPDAPLSEFGKQDMDKLSDELKKHYITLDALYTSPSVRAEESAAILAERLKTPSPIRLEGLHDYLEGSNRLEWIGKAKGEYNAYFNIEHKIPDPEIINNVKQTLITILKESAGKTIYIIKEQEAYVDHETASFNKNEIAKLRETLSVMIKESPGQSIGIVTHGNTAKLLMFLLEHPNEEIPTLKELKEQYKIHRGECWKTSVNDELKLLESPQLFSERKSSSYEKELVNPGKRVEQK